MTKLAYMGIRLEQEMKDRLVLLATEQHRTASDLARHYILQCLESDERKVYWRDECRSTPLAEKLAHEEAHRE